jgi:hypothetical protein
MAAAARKLQPTTAKVETRAAPRASGATVTVGCKVGLGMYLQLQNRREETEDTPGGTRKRVYHDKVGVRYHVAGPERPRGSPPAGYKMPIVVSGAALTSNIPADFWDKWLEQNKDAPYVTGGFVFAHSRRSDVADEAREKVGLTTGLEPLNPENDARMPKPIGSGVGGINVADEMRPRLRSAQEELEEADADSV